MPDPNSNVIYDGFTVLQQGMNSGVAPSLLEKNQMAFAINTTVRGGFATDRPPHSKISLAFPSDAIRSAFENGLFQGAKNYQPDFGAESLICSISGRLYKITPSTNAAQAPFTISGLVEDITIPSDPNPPNQPQAWLEQAENYMIVNDGASLPLFFDGTTTRRSIGSTLITLGIVSVDFLVPGIGKSVSVTLSGPFTGSFGEVVLINQATYQVNNPASAGNITITNLDDAPGTVYPIGTTVQFDPNIATCYTGAATSLNNVGNGSIIPLGVLPFAPQYTGPLGVNTIWPPGIAPGLTWTILAASPTSISLRLNAGQPHGININIGHNTIVRRTPSSQPIQNAGSLATVFTATAVDASSVANLAAQYTGPLPAILTIGTAHYLLTAASGTSPGAVISLKNIDDTTGSPGTTPPKVIATTKIYAIPELPAGRALTYGMGRVWESMTDAISFIAGDIVGGSSGSPDLQFRDSVLKTTENQYLLGGGLFRVPGSVGDIRGMKFSTTLDSSLGQGPLQVFTSQNVFSCQAPVTRSTWQAVTNPILTESLKGAGGASQNALVNSNADIIFRSPDSRLRSLILSRLDFNRWGDTPISHELERIVTQENSALMNYCSAIVFDNRMLMTANPVQSVKSGVYWQGIIALNFDNISSLQEKSQSCYDGIWQGLNVLQLVRFNSSERAFAFCYDTPTASIFVVELFLTGTNHRDDGIDPVEWQFESPVIFQASRQKGEFDLVRLIDGEMYLADVQGSVVINVEYRPDYSPCWYPWNCVYVCSSEGEHLNNQYRSRVGLGEPSAKECVEFNKKPAREGRFFQFRFTISGHCVFQGLKAGCVDVPEVEFERPLCNCQTATALITAGSFTNEVVYFSHACPEGFVLAYVGNLPAWVSIDLQNGRLVGKPGTFTGATKEQATSDAQDALNSFAESALAAGRLYCKNTSSSPGSSPSSSPVPPPPVESNFIILRDDQIGSVIPSNTCYNMRNLNGVLFYCSGVANIYSSPDGLNWTKVFTTLHAVKDVAYGAGVYVLLQRENAFNNQVPYTSPDGINWTPGPNIASFASKDVYGVVFGNGVFTAVTSDGFVATSADGVTWTAQGQITPFAARIKFVNGIFFIIDTNFASKLFTSTNGAAWDAGTTMPSRLEDVAYGNGIFMSVSQDSFGSGDSVSTSPDGTTWTSISFSGIVKPQGLAFNNGMFACGQNGGTFDIATSVNGSVWTDTGRSPIAVVFSSVNFGASTFVCGTD